MDRQFGLKVVISVIVWTAAVGAAFAIGASLADSTSTAQSTTPTAGSVHAETGCTWTRNTHYDVYRAFHDHYALRPPKEVESMIRNGILEDGERHHFIWWEHAAQHYDTNPKYVPTRHSGIGDDAFETYQGHYTSQIEHFVQDVSFTARRMYYAPDGSVAFSAPYNMQAGNVTAGDDFVIVHGRNTYAFLEHTFSGVCLHILPDPTPENYTPFLSRQ